MRLRHSLYFSRTISRTSRPTSNTLLVVLLGLALTGCIATNKPLSLSGANGLYSQAIVRTAPTDLWWAQFDDLSLLRLIEAGQQVSPSLAQADVRIAESRAIRVAQAATLLPTLSATADASRTRASSDLPIANLSSAGLQATWELDLFGARRAATQAAQARLEMSLAAWHEARTLIAVEIAGSYVDLRACEAQYEQAEIDAKSRERIAQLTRLSADAGFQAPAAAELANASAAEGEVERVQARDRCDLFINALRALTAMDETELRNELAIGTGAIPRHPMSISAVISAEALTKRTDVYIAEREVLAASADLASTQAQQLPRIELIGNIAASRTSSSAVRQDGTQWSIGPISFTLPIFDAGARRANTAAAQARYQAAIIHYAAKLREAIREIEGVLISLKSAEKLMGGAESAVLGYTRSYLATEARFRSGLASLFDLEDARRSQVGARRALIEIQREQALLGIDLHRALGADWSSQAPIVRANAASLPNTDARAHLESAGVK